MHIHSALRNQWHKAAMAVVVVKALATNALPYAGANAGASAMAVAGVVAGVCVR